MIEEKCKEGGILNVYNAKSPVLMVINCTKDEI